MQIGINQTAELNVSVNISMMLNPRMLQTLKILNMAYNELLEKINEEAESNPILEIEKRDSMIDYLKSLSGTPVRERTSGKTTAEEERDLENYIKKGTDLSEHLLSQLGLLDIDDDQKELIEHLIKNLDTNGYLPDYEKVRDELAKETGASASDVDEALKALQTLEPDGIGARNARECLLIQIREYNFDSEELRDILEKAVEDHLELLAGKEYGKAARALGITEDAVENIADFIRSNLDPMPGSRFSSASTPAIPSFLTRKDGGSFKVMNLESAYGPKLQLNGSYLKMLEDPRTDQKTVEYIREKIKNAKDLMEQIQRRNDTLQTIVTMMVEAQAEYLDKKASLPRAFSQKEIADKLGIHPSTVSRAVAEKYIETPIGVIKLKQLCPREVLGTTKSSITAAIKKMLGGKDAGGISDLEMKQKLEDKGIVIQRRSISRYRSALSKGSFDKKGKKQ